MIGQRARSLVGPRPALLISASLLVFGLLGTFAFVLVDSQTKSRRDAEKSFAAEARITAQLTASLFTASAASTKAQAAKAFAGPTPSRNALDGVVKRSRLKYALILGNDGRVLAASAGAPAAVQENVAPLPTHVQKALSGQAWLSDVLPRKGDHVIEWALPFETPSGRRVQIEGLDANVLFQFLAGYLSETTSGIRRGYLVDGQSLLIAVSRGAGKLGDRLAGPLVGVGNGRFKANGVDSYVVSAPLEGSDWRVLLSEPTSALYPTLAGSRSWILVAVLGTFGLVGAFCLVLLRGTLVSAARVGETNRQLAEVNATLEERVAERTAVAEQRAQELVRSNAELEQFASVASHDLQEPLRKIRMYCERLPKRLGAALSDEVASDVARMQDAAERMQRLIDDLLSFARLNSRDRGFELVDLDEITREVLGDLEARIAELDARIEVGELPVIAADRAQMSQLMQNLVSNALKFHRDGVAPVVRIRSQVLAAQPPRFSSEAAAGARCAITVEDNGIGFDSKYAERIFSAFQRLHTRSEYEGTGIGLSIARKIAWRHRGEITATSTPGQGSTFTLTMPLPDAARAPAEEEAA